jgi:hypothetical protein
LNRYKLWLGLVVALAFATAGIAVASEPQAQTQTVAATFDADVKRLKTHTCKGSDGTYKVTNAVYLGVAESENSLLDGRIRLHLKSFYNVDEKLGKVSGHVHIRNEETDRRAQARLVAVNSDGKLEGILIGVAGRPRAKLYANFTASLDDSGVTGQLGAGTSGNLAILISRGCERRGPEETAAQERKQERQEERQEQKQRSERSGK